MTTRLPTRAEILDLLGSDARPMHVREIASRLRVSEVDYLGLERLLDSLSLEGVLHRTTRDRDSSSTPKPRRATDATRRRARATTSARGSSPCTRAASASWPA